jgi:hypothetical protein
MTDDQNAYNRNVNKRIAQELAEADEAVVRTQLQLDRWWQAQRDLEAELSDAYMIGGFIEYHSKTPSFHKSKRDRDWRVR